MSLPVARSKDSGLLSPEEFGRIAEIAKREAGLALSPAKNSMISARISRRLRATGQCDFGGYVAFLKSREGAEELRMLISALTTNVSHFFREDHHFRLLETDLLPRIEADARAGRRVRLWSAGCATGQEPYSLAMTILRRFPDAAGHDLRILATDIDETALDRAARGRYAAQQLEGVSPSDRKRFFTDVGKEEMEVHAEVRALVRFRTLNLVGPWPVRGPFDVVFCRNVVIYFDSDTQAGLWPRFHRVIRQDGVLFIGHSERLDSVSAQGFSSIGVTSYRKVTGPDEQSRGASSWH